MGYDVASLLVLGVTVELEEDEDGVKVLPDGTYHYDLLNLDELGYHSDDGETINSELKRRLGCTGKIPVNHMQGYKDFFVLGYGLCYRETGGDQRMPSAINMSQLAEDVSTLSDVVLEDINSHGYSFTREDIKPYHVVVDGRWHLD